MAKKYLEKQWNRWESKDPFVWHKGQFQYARNVNVRDISNWICLSSLLENTNDTGNNPTSRFMYVWNNHSQLVKIETWWFQRALLQNNSQRPTTTQLIWNLTWDSDDFVLKFQEDIWAFWNDITVFDTTLWQWAIAPIASPTYTDPFSGTVHTFWSATAVLDYSNTMLLVADHNKLWRYIPIATPELPIWWKVIREFEDDSEIKGLTMEGNYLKIYLVNNNLDTKIHYAKGTFDVEDTWLVQTVSFDRLYLESVTTDWTSDYALFRNSADSTEYILYEIKWYSRMEMQRTRLPNDGWDMTTFIWSPWNNMDIKDGVLYCPMADWIRTFKKVDWIWSWLLEWTLDDFLWNYYPYNCYIFGDYFYVSCQYQFWWAYRELRANTEWISNTYQPSGFLIWRIYDWWIMWEGKTNLKSTIWYLLSKDSASAWSITIKIRRDRESTWFGNFYTIKTVTDVDKMYADLFPTTDPDFNKEWNVMEYQILLTRWTDETVTPRFYELNLNYDLTRRIKS